MALADLVHRLAKAGATGEMIAMVVEEYETSRQGSRERQRKYRERKKEEVLRVTSPLHNASVTPPHTPPSSSNLLPFTLPSETLPKRISKDIPKGVPKLGSRLPEDFSLPEEWTTWAREKRGWTVRDVAEEAAIFKDYWISKPGKEGRKMNWQATWRNWVRNSRREAQRLTL